MSRFWTVPAVYRRVHAILRTVNGEPAHRGASTAIPAFFITVLVALVNGGPLTYDPIQKFSRDYKML